MCRKIESKKMQLTLLNEMNSYGANGNKEFRITELKGFMRYWWRVLSSYSDHIKMLDDEGVLFGNSSDHMSPIRIKSVVENQFTGKVNNKIDLEIICNQDRYKLNTIWNLNQYIDLIKIVSILGGLGKGTKKCGGVFKAENAQDENMNICKMVWNLLGELKLQKNFKIEIENNSICRKLDKFCNYICIDKIIFVESNIKENKSDKASAFMKQYKNIDSNVSVYEYNKKNYFVISIMNSDKNIEIDIETVKTFFGGENNANK